MKRSGYFTMLYMAMAFVIMLTLSWSACSTPAKEPSTAAPSATAGPRYGGTLRIGLDMKPTSLNGFVGGSSGNGAGYAVVKTFGQCIDRWVGKSDREAMPGPQLAKSWEISPDGLTWIFHIQQGIKWPNNSLMKGREFTADDIKYHLDRQMDPANKSIGRVTLDIKKTEAPDKYTLRVTNNQKSPGFLGYICYGTGVPNPKEVVEAPGGAEVNWAGTGAFILSDYNKDTKAILKKNPDFWQPGKPYLDSVEFYFMPDASARLAAFRAGQIDVLPLEGKANRDSIERTVPGVQIQDGCGILDAGLYLNNTRKPLDNKLVRQAVLYAIDYDGLINAALDGAGMRTYFIATWFKEWGAKQPADLPKRDVAKAKALLAQAGYPDGFKLTILQDAGRMAFVGNAIEPLAAMLRDVGIEASIVPLDTASFLSRWRASDFDMAAAQLQMCRPIDPDNSLRQDWTTKSSFNFMKYSNPKVDELIAAEQAAFPDKDKRISIVKQLWPILDDEVPAIPLYITTNYFIKQSWVKGWDDMGDPQGGYAVDGIPSAWIDKK